MDEEDASKMPFNLMYLLIAVMLVAVIIYLAISNGKYNESNDALSFLIGLLRR